MIPDKHIFGYLSIILTVCSVAPYYYSIFTNRTKPHAFSWMIWGTLATIAFTAQYVTGAGPGAWGTAAGAVTCFSIAAFGFFKGERNITTTDWVALIAAYAAIPCWYYTKDPLSAVIMVSVIDLLGYYPTFRKSYFRPHQELIFIHALGSVKYAVSLLAIEQFSLVTWLYPASVAITSAALAAMIFLRRKHMEQAA